MNVTHRATRLLALLVMALVAGCDNSTSTTSSSPSTTPSGGPSTASTSQPTNGLALRFSAIPDQNSTELKEKFDALAAHLSYKLGVPVTYVPATDYKASVEMFKNGDIQLAWFGGLTGVQARQAVPGARAIAQGDTDPKFVSYFVANAAAPIQPSSSFPADLAKLSFTFGPASSTSGRLMPEYYLRKNAGKSPAEFFGKEPAFSEGHDKTLELVEAGKVQAGVVNFEVYDKRVADKKTDPAKVRIIWKTPTYADYNFTAHPDLDKQFGAGFVDKLQKTLVAVSDPNLLAAFPRKKLIPAKNEDYAQIEQVAKDLGFLR
jgi:phosphonate transport system substrate-binding protein